MSDTERLILLEERYAHLQRHVTQQDKAILDLVEEVARLRHELLALRERVTEAREPGEEPERPPPHY